MELVFQFQFQFALMHVRHCPDLLTVDDDEDQLRLARQTSLVTFCSEQFRGRQNKFVGKSFAQTGDGDAYREEISCGYIRQPRCVSAI
jgi:hypothetical protein